jgi:hypothetical protein
MIWIVVYNGLISVILAHFFGKKKKIGFVYGLLFCLLFGFIIGGLMIISSPRKEKEIPYRKTTPGQWAGLGVCLLLSVAMFYMSHRFQKDIDRQKWSWDYNYTPYEYELNNIKGWTQMKWIFICFGVGFIVAGIYTVDGQAKPKNVAISSSPAP